jgi:penicillin-binding protein 1C
MIFGKRRVVIFAAVFTAGVVAFVIWSVSPLWNAPPQPKPPTKVLFRDGSPMYEVLPETGERQQPVKLGDVPRSVTDAIISAEDQRFYRHHGVDALALLRAVWSNVTRQTVVSGASTLEEQLVKNLYFFSSKRTFVQKVREAIAAFAWSATHSKEQTLEAYVNAVPFGSGMRGIGSASRVYFQTDAKDLNTAQAAMLAGVIAAPSAYDPFLHTDKARTRQSWVLERMVASGSLTPDERQRLGDVKTPIFAPRHSIAAPHAVFRILDELETTIPDIREGGYAITTTLDPSLQSQLERSVAHRLDQLDGKNASDAAAVAIDPRSGDVLAYIGSADYFNDNISGRVDMAAAKRQPGSALKPFLFLLAFLRGVPPSSPVADTPVRFTSADGQPYYPRNYDYRFHGPVTLRDALGSSLNVPAVKLLDRLGLRDFFGFLGAFGVTFPEPPDYYGLGIVLGGGEVTLFDTTNAYAALARGGYAGDAKLVERVTDVKGQTVLSVSKPETLPVFLDRERLALASQLLTDVLSDPTARTMAFGERSQLNTGRRIAVKTGTTYDFRDNWAFGYAPDLALGVWVGNADNRPMDGVSGIAGAVPVWADIVRERYRDTGEIPWNFSPGLASLEVCIPSGLLPTDLCSKRRVEKFIPGTEPTAQDTWYMRCADGRVALNPPDEYRTGAVDVGCETAGRAPRILTPLSGDTYALDRLVDAEAQGIPFTASTQPGGQSVWRLDGQAIKTASNPYLWNPVPGEHVLELQGASGTIRFSVQE